MNAVEKLIDEWAERLWQAVRLQKIDPLNWTANERLAKQAIIECATPIAECLMAARTEEALQDLAEERVRLAKQRDDLNKRLRAQRRELREREIALAELERQYAQLNQRAAKERGYARNCKARARGEVAAC